MLDESFHRFGPFIIVRTLGRGGMGEVFVARTPQKDHPIAAVKRLRPDVARVPTFADRFQHEADLAVRLNHENIVHTLDVGSVEGQLYVCAELIMGKDTGLIADRLRERGQGGPAAVAIALLSDALAGLRYMHTVSEPDGTPLRLVHRDVTPGNLLVGYDGLARLADFGLAKSALTENARLTSHGEILGTPHYLAPEVIKGDRATPGSDLYGLGAVTYRFLTGVAPYQGTTTEVLLKVLTEDPRPLSELRPDLPPWLVAFVHRMLDRDPSRRPNDAGVLLRQLRQDARNSGLLVPRTSVSRWLTTLFETEHAEEMEQWERVLAIDPTSTADKPEGTVVLARIRAESRLQAPPDADSQGTDLDLSEADVRGALDPIPTPRRRPIVPVPSEFDLQSPSHSDVTEAAQRVQLPRIADASYEDDSLDGMPTRAVAVPRTLFSSPPTPRIPAGGPTQHDRPLPDPANGIPTRKGRTDDTLEPTREDQKQADVESGETHLPGFVDGERRPPTARPLVRTSRVVVPLTPTEPAPAPTLREVLPMEREASRDRDREPGRDAGREVAREPGREVARERGRTEGSVPPGATAKAHGATSPPKAPVTPRAPRSRESTFARNLTILAALLIGAIVLGIGIGVLVASFKRPQVIVETDAGAHAPSSPER